VSVLRTLDRLHRVVRLEAKRNPAFAARLEHALRAYANPELGDDPNTDEAPPAAPTVELAQFNPTALLGKGGEDALREALAPLGDNEIRALLAEHNLDPAGLGAALNGPDLADHVVAQARKRIERDKKLFDY
jgi:hypothetical protein